MFAFTKISQFNCEMEQNICDLCECAFYAKPFVVSNKEGNYPYDEIRICPACNSNLKAIYTLDEKAIMLNIRGFINHQISRNLYLKESLRKEKEKKTFASLSVPKVVVTDTEKEEEVPKKSLFSNSSTLLLGTNSDKEKEKLPSTYKDVFSFSSSK